jgi:glycosyltransferase involved in cell wall biosynthesis
VLVSIIITNHNYGKYIAQAIDSALNQSHPDIEVIVVDDGSTDDSRDIISGYGDRIRYLFADRAGQIAGINAGFARSHGDVVMLLDADDVLYPDAAARHVAAFEDPAVVKSQGYLQIVGRDGRHASGKMPMYLSPGGNYQKRFLSHGPFAYQCAFTSGCAWRRSLLDAVLPLPEPRFGFVGPDGYLGAVDAMFGRIAVVDGAVGEYRIHDNNNGPIAYRFDVDYLRDRVSAFEKRVEFAAHHATVAGLEIDTARWMAHAGWKLTLSRHVLSLLGEGHQAVAIRELCLSPFSMPERSFGLAAARALQLGLIGVLPDRMALWFARRVMNGDWGKRLRSIRPEASPLG